MIAPFSDPSEFGYITATLTDPVVLNGNEPSEYAYITVTFVPLESSEPSEYAFVSGNFTEPSSGVFVRLGGQRTELPPFKIKL